ncbi:DUF6327 family protein [Polaribacter porphyrae]|uniref:Glutaminyl-tRNA synthetase n=1 Tax=Polaribacter porphyrae TaxID=1137780 RepID=A0A2S7WSQ1_9FLAO|nr:DUF6327 family protein [Polaribacter porphyrae]PQJ80613.1 hypothetical protein BTO18_16150 [Polaribacter porphyrae]
MKTYTSFIEIEKDLRKLELERDIAKEELKIVKHNFEDFLKPVNWVTTILKAISKYGVLLMIKRIFK